MTKFLAQLLVWTSIIVCSFFEIGHSKQCNDYELIENDRLVLLRNKFKGEEPSYNELTKNVTNVDLKKSRIEALQKEFSLLSGDKCYKSQPIPVIYNSDAMNGKLYVTVPFRGTGVSGYVHIDQYFDIDLNESTKFNTLSLIDLKSQSKFFSDLATNIKQVPGNIVFYFSRIYADQRTVQIPTVIPSRPNQYAKVRADVSKVDFFTKDNKKIYVVNIEDGLNSDSYDLPTENIKLSKSVSSSDFDIRGLTTKMSIDEMKHYAEKQGWSCVVKPNVINTLVMCPAGIDCNSSMSEEPSGSFRLNVKFDNDNIYCIEYETDINSTREAVAKLIVGKYGIPLQQDEHDRSVYYYGEDLSAIRNSSKYQKYHNWLPEHIFRVRIVEYQDSHNQLKPTGKYKISLWVGNPPVVTQELKPMEPQL